MAENLEHRRTVAKEHGLVEIERHGQVYFVTPEAAESIERMDTEREERMLKEVAEEFGVRACLKATWRSLMHRLKITLMLLLGAVFLSQCGPGPHVEDAARSTYVQRRIRECVSLKEVGCDVKEVRIRPGAFGTVVECVADCGDMR